MSNSPLFDPEASLSAVLISDLSPLTDLPLDDFDSVLSDAFDHDEAEEDDDDDPDTLPSLPKLTVSD